MLSIASAVERSAYLCKAVIWSPVEHYCPSACGHSACRRLSRRGVRSDAMMPLRRVADRYCVCTGAGVVPARFRHHWLHCRTSSRQQVRSRPQLRDDGYWLRSAARVGAAGQGAGQARDARCVQRRGLLHTPALLGLPACLQRHQHSLLFTAQRDELPLSSYCCVIRLSCLIGTALDAASGAA